jgi:hypothetical protein
MTTETAASAGNQTRTGASVTAESAGPIDTDGWRPDGTAGAVWDALRAYSGESAAVIARHARVSEATARRALKELVGSGRATRLQGGRVAGRRVADTWYARVPGESQHDDAGACGSDSEVDNAATALISGGSDAGARASTAAVVDSTESEATDASWGAEIAETVEAAGAEVTDGHVDPGAGSSSEDVDRLAEQEVAERGAPRNEATDAETSDRETSMPAVVQAAEVMGVDADGLAEVERVLHALSESVSQALAGLRSGDSGAAIRQLVEVQTVSALAHRLGRRVMCAQRTPSGRARLAPGALRHKMLDHLRTYRGQDFTPYELARAIGGHSAGAVANALDRLSATDQVVQTCEHPRRYTAAPTGTEPAPERDAEGNVVAH